VSHAVSLPVTGTVHAPAMTAPATPATGVCRHLSREWIRLRTRPDALRRAATWSLVDEPLYDLDQLLAVVGYAVASTPRTEAALRRLVIIAAGDELAARIVVQRILPGLLAAVRRRAGCSDSPCDELIGAAWITIRTYRATRRPACIAAALIADADYLAFRLAWRRASNGERPTGLKFEALDATPLDALTPTLDGVLRAAHRAGVPDPDLELIRKLAADVPTSELAVELRVSARTVRNRRDRITGRLRDLMDSAA
jgi:hypothetical protein